jgi:hypothetical protein
MYSQPASAVPPVYQPVILAKDGPLEAVGVPELPFVGPFDLAGVTLRMGAACFGLLILELTV